MLHVGLVGEAVMVVEDQHTARVVGSGSVAVLATPMLIALMERAAMAAVAGELAVTETTVGTKIDVAHTAATPMGLTVTARAVLTEIDGRRLQFVVTAEDDAGNVGQGKHERFVVEVEAFVARAEKRLAR